MKHYYYAENDEQLGPFTLEELKTKRLKKSTLVWTEGMTDWVLAITVEELKDILISEPPPLPKRKQLQTTETVNIKKATAEKTDAKYDLTYDKERGATVFGVLIIAALIIINFSNVVTIDNRALIGVTFLIIRIISIVTVVNIAKRQNRNSTVWGFFAFFFPAIALIIIGSLRKLRIKVKFDGNSPLKEQSILKDIQPEIIYLTKEQKLEIDKRMERFENKDAKLFLWEDIKQKIKATL